MEEFTLFWNGPFSQWHPSPFKFMGKDMSCAEQAMMFSKAVFFKDEERAQQILETQSPREQKSLGRQVEGFDAKQWETVAKDVVYVGSYLKFTQNFDLCKELVNTYPTILVEASPYDKIWGIGLGENDPDALIPERWKGKNWLGEVLIKCRTDIMAGSGINEGAKRVVWSIFHS